MRSGSRFLSKGSAYCGNEAKVPVPKLRIAYTHLQAYEKQRG
jgi:hypothetical protein